MKATFKQVHDAQSLLKAIMLIYDHQTIQNLYGEGLAIIWRALEEVEIDDNLNDE